MPDLLRESYDTMLRRLGREYAVDTETSGGKKMWTINKEKAPEPILSLDEYQEETTE